MKLHLGCGPVYLIGYINVDANPDLLANGREVVARENATTMDRYYRHDFGKAPKRVVADVAATFDDLPFDTESASEVVMLHALEHVAEYDRPAVLSEIHRVLEVGGRLIVGVPDVRGIADEFVASQTAEEEAWAIRQLYGSQRNRWSHHLCGYTRQTLEAVLGEHGFGEFVSRPNINFYPSIHLEAVKK